MLGAAFFHMLPEAVHLGGPDVIPWAVAGFLFLFLLERFVLVHVCAEPGPSERLLGHPAPPPHGLREHAGHDHAHEATGCDVHTLGLAAFVGLSLHTLVDGFALGAAQSDPALGLLVFVAILAHKIPSSVSLTAILRAEGYGTPAGAPHERQLRAHGPGGRRHLPGPRPGGGRAAASPRSRWPPAPAPSSSSRSPTSCPTCTGGAATAGRSRWRCWPDWRPCGRSGRWATPTAERPAAAAPRRWSRTTRRSAPGWCPPWAAAICTAM